MENTEQEVDHKVMELAYRLAYEYEQMYGCCPQCVLAAIDDTLGGIDDATFKASHVFAGGGGLTTGGTCGALVGGLLALSSKHGRDRDRFAGGRFLQSYKLGKQLHERFVAEFGSAICADVQAVQMGRSYNMWEPRDYHAFELAGGHKDKCPSVAGRVARWTAEMLMAGQEEDKK